MGESKRAQEADQLAVARQKTAVGVALVRAKCLRQMLDEEHDRYPPGQQPEPTIEDWKETRVSGGTRLEALLITSLAALYTVVDGWRRNRLSDPRIDKLLESSHVAALGGFRNALLHPRSLGDPRLLEMLKVHRDLLPWANELLAAFDEHFVAWFARPLP
jgi:hypothetical protein